MHVDLVRELQKQLRDVSLEETQPAYVELVRRLRLAGIKVSDRRAVKLQRMVAASALLCGRTTTIPSDLWVLRYIWDSDEQQEVIAALVNNAIQAAGASDQAGSHPRAKGDGAPNPELIAVDLRRIAGRLNEQTLSDIDRAQLRDELGLLASRCEWVSNSHQREFLRKEIETLWQQFDQSTSNGSPTRN